MINADARGAPARTAREVGPAGPGSQRLLGIDHERFTCRSRGIGFRLTGVAKASVAKAIVA